MELNIFQIQWSAIYNNLTANISDERMDKMNPIIDELLKKNDSVVNQYPGYPSFILKPYISNLANSSKIEGNFLSIYISEISPPFHVSFYMEKPVHETNEEFEFLLKRLLAFLKFTSFNPIGNGQQPVPDTKVIMDEQTIHYLIDHRPCVLSYLMPIPIERKYITSVSDFAVLLCANLIRRKS